MQPGLDERNREALERRGAKKILAELANVYPSDTAAAQSFMDSYGRLRPGWDEPIYVLGWAQKFRQAWEAQASRDRKKIDAVNYSLDDIFKAETLNNLYERPAIAADFGSGKWEPQPRYLLDHLGLQLMQSRKMLHRCERPECQRYMIKEFSRDRYCSRMCAEVMRSRGQSKWAEDHQEEIKRRRRKDAKKRKP